MKAFTIREAGADDASRIARIHVDSWRETYQGLIPARLLNGLQFKQREVDWKSALKQPANTVVFVAQWPDGIYGFASAGSERSADPQYGGELYAIYLLQAKQKCGAGQALFDSVRRRLIESGYRSMLVWVLEGNPACGFYEAMGGRRVGNKDERFGKFLLREVGYAFNLN